MLMVLIFYLIANEIGDRGSTVVKVMRYKSEGSIPDGVIAIFH
jgi:hypothetical protein